MLFAIHGILQVGEKPEVLAVLNTELPRDVLLERVQNMTDYDFCKGKKIPGVEYLKFDDINIEDIPDVSLTDTPARKISLEAICG